MNPEIDTKEWDHTEESKYGLGGVRTPEKFYKVRIALLFGSLDSAVSSSHLRLCFFFSDIWNRCHK